MPTCPWCDLLSWLYFALSAQILRPWAPVSWAWSSLSPLSSLQPAVTPGSTISLSQQPCHLRRFWEILLSKLKENYFGDIQGFLIRLPVTHHIPSPLPQGLLVSFWMSSLQYLCCFSLFHFPFQSHPNNIIFGKVNDHTWKPMVVGAACPP